VFGEFADNCRNSYKLTLRREIKLVVEEVLGDYTSLLRPRVRLGDVNSRGRVYHALRQ